MDSESDLCRPGARQRLDAVLALVGAILILAMACALGPGKLTRGTAQQLWNDPGPVQTAALVGFSPQDAEMMARVMDRAWDWTESPGQVPNLGPLTMPEGMHDLTVAERKELFMRAVLPHVLYANRLIAERRMHLEAMLFRLECGQSLQEGDRAFLMETAQRYRLAEQALETIDPDPQRLIHALLDRVDVIPASLVLAQAAMESAWGTSRFVREGNNLFGQWVFSARGMTPKNRPDGANYSVARYETLAESVAAYTRNLNTLWAYQEFRDIRARMRAIGAMQSQQLAQGLLRYSTRRQAYVDEIRSMIRTNQLESYDEAQLMRMDVKSLEAALEGEISSRLKSLESGLDV